MENILPTYVPPLKSAKEPTISIEYWDEARDSFDNKEYKKSIIALLNYMNSDILKGVNTKKDINISKVHDSSKVNISITDTLLTIDVPFLKINENTNQVALLRKVAEVNFARFDLAQITLHEDKLSVHHELPLELCQPYKVYTLLREIVFRSGEFTHEFIEKYGATFIKEPNHARLSEKEQNEAYLQIEMILNEYEQYSNYFKEKRWESYQWDIEVITLLKLANMPYMNGLLKHQLIFHIDLMYNGNQEFNYRVEKGRNYIKKLSSMSREEMLSNLYHAELFVSMLWRSSEDIVVENLNNHFDAIEKYVKEDNAFSIAYYLESIFLKLIYNYNLEENYKNAIEYALIEVSGQKPEEAAPRLLNLYYTMRAKKLNENIDLFTKKKKSKFRKFSEYFIYFWIGTTILEYFVRGN